MDRRDFLKTAGVASAWPRAAREQAPTPAASDRDVWIGVLHKLADPLLNNLANGLRYAAVQERLIAPDGTFPALGRSIAYRCGAFHLLGAGGAAAQASGRCRARAAVDAGEGLVRATVSQSTTRAEISVA